MNFWRCSVIAVVVLVFQCAAFPQSQSPGEIPMAAALDHAARSGIVRMKTLTQQQPGTTPRAQEVIYTMEFFLYIQEVPYVFQVHINAAHRLQLGLNQSHFVLKQYCYTAISFTLPSSLHDK